MKVCFKPQKNFSSCKSGFCFRSPLRKKEDLYHKPKKNPGDNLKKKFRCAGPEIFLRFETDLNSSRPWFSEIKVQIKRPIVGSNIFLWIRTNSFEIIKKGIYQVKHGGLYRVSMSKVKSKHKKYRLWVKEYL